MEHLSIQDGHDITADGRFKDVLPLVLSFLDNPVDMAKFKACSRSARGWSANFEVKYMWLRQQRSDKALLLASRAGGAHEPLFLRLLRTMGLEGADAQDAKGNTPLHYCCAAGWNMAVCQLAQAANRGSVEAKTFNKAGHTPLHIASASGHPGCVAPLLNVRGCDVNARVCGGDTALYLALEGRQAAHEAGQPVDAFTECVQLLTEAGGISFSGKQLMLV